MLIRSQNKNILLNFEKVLCVMNYGNQIVISNAPRGDINDLLNIGEYSTEEKALKVLNKIQEFYYQFINAQNPLSTMVANTTFEMPQDNEVQ